VPTKVDPGRRHGRIDVDVSDSMPVLELSRGDVPPARARALVFEDPLSRELRTLIERLAPTEATVLVTGETGVGKEIVARHIHDLSQRARAPFVAVNCGALALSLVDSELFGHEKGAFTGAVASQTGWFEAAHGGTLFLDEIGDLPLAAQVKLLRVLQEREVVRIGARRPIRIDVRLVAATNANLEQSVAEGTFREDLFYRLNVAHLAIAPLRERAADLMPLARHFLATHAVRLGIDRAELTDEAVRRLTNHPWPGNIRELENAIHHALLVSRGGVIDGPDLQLSTAGVRRLTAHPPPPPAPVPEPGEALERALLSMFEEERTRLHEDVEEILYRTAFRFSHENQVRTARLLGISRNIVRARLIRYGLIASSSRSAREAPVEKARATPRVRVGHQAFGVLSLLKATRALEEVLGAEGVEVEWIECATGMQLVDALAAGALDLGVVGEAAPIFAQAARAPVVYLAAEPPAPEGEAIVVRAASPLAHLAELRGKSLAVTRGANVAYFAARALEEVGLALTDVHVRAFTPLAARTAFAYGEVDAWATWDPLLASVQELLPTRILRDARGLADNRAFYVARRAFADAYPEVVETFLGQAGAVGRWANHGRPEAARLLSAQLGLSEPSIEAALGRASFDARPLDAEALAAQQRIADALYRMGFVTRRVDVREAVWPGPADALRSA
jgi:aliphatic sulfonates family ABC transporter substrate-binding protein